MNFKKLQFSVREIDLSTEQAPNTFQLENSAGFWTVLNQIHSCQKTNVF